MFTLTTVIHVDDLRGDDVYEFLTNPSDDRYQRWWPGTHLYFRLLEEHAGHVGDLVSMDEFIGPRRVRMRGVVTEAVPCRRIAWQWKPLVRLPVRLTLDLRDDEAGVTIMHTTHVGFRGPGAVLDPLFRLYFSRTLVRDLDAHVRAEFPKLRHLRRLGTLKSVHAHATDGDSRG